MDGSELLFPKESWVRVEKKEKQLNASKEGLPDSRTGPVAYTYMTQPNIEIK